MESPQSNIRLAGRPPGGAPSKKILLSGRAVGRARRFPSRMLRIAWSRSPRPTVRPMELCDVGERSAVAPDEDLIVCWREIHADCH